MDKSINDTSKISEYVVTGAQLSCSLGSVPSNLMMPMSHGTFLKGKAQCNVGDSKPIVNIMCFGTCNISAPPPPCVPATGMPWVNNQGTNLLIDDQRALIKDANAFCSRGGIISIDRSGQ